MTDRYRRFEHIERIEHRLFQTSSAEDSIRLIRSKGRGPARHHLGASARQVAVVGAVSLVRLLC